MPSNPHGFQQKQQNHVGMYLVYKVKRIAQKSPSFIFIIPSPPQVSQPSMIWFTILQINTWSHSKFTYIGISECTIRFDSIWAIRNILATLGSFRWSWWNNINLTRLRSLWFFLSLCLLHFKRIHNSWLEKYGLLNNHKTETVA